MKTSTRDSSLELLLDTICNTFGGILFIALLTVVLLSQTSQNMTPEPPDAAAQANLAARLVEAKAESARLEQIVEEQEKTARLILRAPELPELASQLSVAERCTADLMRQKNETLRKAGDTQQDVNAIASELKALDEEMARAREALAAAKAKLEQEIQQRSRTGDLPKARRTNKHQFAFMLRGGCLYDLSTRGSNQQQVSLKTDKTTNEQYWEPITGTGISVNTDGGVTKALLQKLGNFNQDTQYIKVFVWPDSFGHFRAVKNALVQEAFEYCLEPMAENGRVVLGSPLHEDEVQ